jgi:hypothetical protein
MEILRNIEMTLELADVGPRVLLLQDDPLGGDDAEDALPPRRSSDRCRA